MFTFNFKLFKVPFTYEKNGKKFTSYNFYLYCVENGRILRVNKENFQDKNGKWHDNYDRLCDLATTVTTYEEIKNNLPF